MANIEKITYKGDVYDISDAKALHQDAAGSWMPDFAKLKVLATYEFDIASTSYYKICERANVATITDLTDEVLAFRITVTGSSIMGIADCVARVQPTVNGAPRVTVSHQTRSTSAGTTGIRYMRIVNPKAVNTSYKYVIEIAAYNATARHIKVEVFKAPDSWTFFNTATTFSYNSTNQTATDITLYDRLGIIGSGTLYMTANYATYAGYKSSWDALFNSQGNFLAAGAAIAANQFVFFGKDNKVYPTTSTSVEIDPAWPIVYCTTAVSSGSAVTYSYIRTWGYFTPASSILKDGTLTADDTVYMRCTYTDGKLYSANTMTQTLAAGNTYIKLGKMYSATAVSVNTYNSEFFTLDTDGHLKALNGYLLNADKATSAAAVSKVGTTATGLYGVLLDSNLITDVVNTTTSPRVNAGLTFNPSTGNLSSTLFTGSGAGLTNIPLSSIQDADELLPTKTLHVYHDIDLDTYEFTDSLTAQEIKDILDDASDGTINLQISMVDVDTSKLLKYYQSGNMFIAKYLIFEDTPAIDMTTYQNHSLQSYFGIVWSAGSDTFQFAPIPGDDLATLSQQLMQLLAAKEDLSNKVTSISSSSTDDEYPSAKCVYDAISGISPGGGGSGEGYYVGTCPTGASTATKVVTVSDSSFTLRNGVRISVEMTYGNTSNSPKLNVNGAGAKPILVAHIATGNVTELNSAAMLQAFSQVGVFDFRYYSAYNSNAGGWILQYTPQVFAVGSRYVGGARGTTLDLANIQEGGLRYGLWAATATHAPFSSGVTAAISMFHDSNAAYTRQIAISTGSFPKMAIRTQNNTTWGDWRYVLTAPTELSAANNNLMPVSYQYSAQMSITGNAMTIPINGTKYRLTQLQLLNMDTDYGLGSSEVYLFNVAGTLGYKLGQIRSVTTSGTASGITVTFTSGTTDFNGSTNVQTIAYYAEIE